MVSIRSGLTTTLPVLTIASRCPDKVCWDGKLSRNQTTMIKLPMC